MKNALHKAIVPSLVNRQMSSPLVNGVPSAEFGIKKLLPKYKEDNANWIEVTDEPLMNNVFTAIIFCIYDLAAMKEKVNQFYGVVFQTKAEANEREMDSMEDVMKKRLNDYNNGMEPENRLELKDLRGFIERWELFQMGSHARGDRPEPIQNTTTLDFSDMKSPEGRIRFLSSTFSTETITHYKMMLREGLWFDLACACAANKVAVFR